MKDDERKMWRTKNGLNENEGIHNPDKLERPSLKWVDKPGRENMKEERKANLIKELQKVEGNFETHVNGQLRIENRENCIVRLTFKGLDTVTYNK